MDSFTHVQFEGTDVIRASIVHHADRLGDVCHEISSASMANNLSIRTDLSQSQWLTGTMCEWEIIIVW